MQQWQWKTGALFYLGLIAASSLAMEVDSNQSLAALLDTEVQGASRFAQPLSEAPSPVTVITADDIRRHDLRTPGEALSLVPGVFTSYDRIYTNIAIRGFGLPGDYNSRIQFQVDGASYNDTIFDQALLGPEAPIAMEWIKRLEFVSGSSSALYGGNALFGIVNAELWSGEDINGTRLGIHAGRFGERSVYALTGRRLDDGADWVMGISAYGRRGDDLFFPEFVPLDGAGMANGLDGEHTLKAYAKYSQGGWRAMATYARRLKDIPTAPWDTTFNRAGNHAEDEHIHLDLTHSASLSALWQQFVRMHLGQYTYRGHYLYTYAGDDYVNLDLARTRWLSGEYRLGYAGFDGHHISLGVSARKDLSVRQRNFIEPDLNLFEDEHGNRNLALHASDEWRISPRWIANMSGRIDWLPNTGSITSPRLALIHRPLPEMAVKLLWGRAFRSPNLYERYYNDGGITQLANPGLKPEKMESKEITVDYAFTSSLKGGLSHYRYEIRDLIEFDTDASNGLSRFENLSQAHARGWDMNGEILLGQGWHVRGNLTWQSVSLDSGPVVNSPRRLGKLRIDGPLSSHWNLGLNLQAMSNRRSFAGNTLSGHTIANLTLSQQAQGPYGRWQISWHNAGDKAYADSAASEHRLDAIPQDGRLWSLGWELAL